MLSIALQSDSIPAVSFASASTDTQPEIQMISLTTTRAAFKRAVVPAAAIASLLACAPAAGRAEIPPAPIALRWPDPTFLPERQCHRAMPAERLEGYLRRATLTMAIPGTRSVTLDRQRGCLTIVVEGVGSGRLAELIIRGVAVPRSAVLLMLAPAGRG
jgi:hypothetical protein